MKFTRALSFVSAIGLLPLHAELSNISLTADVANSDPSGYSTNLTHTTTDPFAYDPDNPTSALPSMNWNPATHFHGNGANSTVTLYWSLDERLWSDGSDLYFDFYGRTDCCGERDNNYDIALLDGGPLSDIGAKI